MNEEELLQSIVGKTIRSMIGKTIQFVKPYAFNDEIEFIEIAFTDGTAIAIQAHSNSNTREGFLSIKDISNRI